MLGQRSWKAANGAQAAWRPSVRPQRAARQPLVARSSSRAAAALTSAEQDVLTAVEGLGYPAALFPGDESARKGIDVSIAALEAASPISSPLRQAPAGQPAPELLGDWKLIYASSGTYVTRTAAAQALLAASKLPGVGVADIRQSLQLGDASSGAAQAGTSSSGGKSSSGEAGSKTSSSSGGGSAEPHVQLRTSNAASFGLGPFGEWEVEIGGVWAVQDGSLARVSFDGFTLQLVGLLGLIKLPSMMKVSVPIINSAAADFRTTYLSGGVRVARGRSGNIFLFSRLPPS